MGARPETTRSSASVERDLISTRSESIRYQRTAARGICLPNLHRTVPILACDEPVIATTENPSKVFVSVDTPAFYSTPSLVKRIESGAVKGTGGGAKANVELLVSLKPGVVITYGTGSGSFDGIDKLQSAGLPTLVKAGYMEETPLGRAEWVKLIGALTNRDSEAEAEFTRWSNDYRSLAAKVSATKLRPTVISGSMYQGTWYMPGGKSFASQYIRDAGGSYPWASDGSTGSLSLDFESVLDKGYDATVWINAGFEWKTLRDTVADDARYARLLAYKDRGGLRQRQAGERHRRQ